MEYIILIIAGYFLLKFCGKMLRKICSPENTALWLAVLFCWLIMDWFWIGAVLLAWRYVLMPIARYRDRHPKRYQRNAKDNRNLNKAILWAIPVFWPVLIARMFFSGKTYKPTMDEYDYEQYLKGNGK